MRDRSSLAPESPGTSVGWYVPLGRTGATLHLASTARGERVGVAGLPVKRAELHRIGPGVQVEEQQPGAIAGHPRTCHQPGRATALHEGEVFTSDVSPQRKDPAPMSAVANDQAFGFSRLPRCRDDHPAILCVESAVSMARKNGDCFPPMPTIQQEPGPSSGDSAPVRHARTPSGNPGCESTSDQPLKSRFASVGTPPYARLGWPGRCARTVGPSAYINQGTPVSVPTNRGSAADTSKEYVGGPPVIGYSRTWGTRCSPSPAGGGS